MAEEFAGRHIGPSATKTDRMLSAAGVGALDPLLDRPLPEPLHHPVAGAEEMEVLHRLSERGGTRSFADAECDPQRIAGVRLRAEPIGIDVVVGEVASSSGVGDMPAEGVFGVLLQYPGPTGVIRDD